MKGKTLIIFFVFLSEILSKVVYCYSWGRVERFHLYGYGLMRFVDEYSDYGNNSFNASLLEGILDAELDSWFKHPYVFQYHIGLGGYDTYRFAENTRGNSFTGLYNLWFTLFPAGEYSLSAYTRRNVTYLSEKNLPSTKLIDESYGGSIAVKKIDLPNLLLRADSSRFYTDRDENIEKRDTRNSVLGIAISKPYENNIFSGIYEYRNQKDYITSADYIQHYVNIYDNTWWTPKTLLSLYFTNNNQKNDSDNISSGTNTINATSRLFYRPSNKSSHAWNYSVSNTSGMDTISYSNDFVYDFEYYLTRTFRTIDSLSIQMQKNSVQGETNSQWEHRAQIGGQLIQPYKYAQLRTSYFISPALIDKSDEVPVSILSNSASIGGSVSAIPIITLSSDASFTNTRANASNYSNEETKRVETRITNRYTSRWRFDTVSIYEKNIKNEPLSGITRRESFSNTVYIDRYMRRLVESIAGGYTVAHESIVGEVKTWFVEARLGGKLTKRLDANISAQHSESSSQNEFESLWYEQGIVSYVNGLLAVSLEFYGTQRVHQHNINTFLVTIRRNFNEYF